MATVSSHILDSVRGRPAAGIRCQLFRLAAENERQPVFDVIADREGRISETVDIDASNQDCEFELVFHGEDYFRAQSLAPDSIVKIVVIRFVMDEDGRRYHLPLMLAPHSYSTWWAGQN